MKPRPKLARLTEDAGLVNEVDHEWIFRWLLFGWFTISFTNVACRSFLIDFLLVYSG